MTFPFASDGSKYSRLLVEVSPQETLVLKCWLRNFGVTIESERSARKFISVEMPSYTVKAVPMTNKAGEMLQVNMVFFPS